TSCTLLIFVLTMLLFPDAQMNAQLEIDCVVGAHRFPSFEDRPSLPYVEAVLREVMRWRPVTPLGIPHCAMEDDMYEGYFIPKGNILGALDWTLNF
ncbi:cytochrome P450, partial [Coniophora puteana RWD-64-598 SS2]